MSVTLPQLVNTVEIVGTLKALDLEESVAKTSGKKFIKGTVTLVSNHDGKIHEHRISVFQMEKNKKGDVTKLYKGLLTMMKEFKSIEALGEENADRIRVTGEVELEEYYGRDEQLRSFNKIKGVFFNRIEADKDVPDKAIASIEVVVKGFSPVTDQESGEILHYAVNAFTVGYGERVVELKKATVSTKLADAMQNLYSENSTGRLTFKLNNYVEKIEKEAQEEPVSMSHGFGSEEKPEESRVFDRFVNNLEITGGDIPFEEPKALTAEQIAEAARKRALVLAELKQNANSAPETPQDQPTGFGSLPDVNAGLGNLPSKAPILPPTETAEDDMPDF